MKMILVSECLYGGRTVRYDAADTACTDEAFLIAREEGLLIPVCPEVCGGLPVPRSAAQRFENRVITEDGSDVTAEFTKGAEEALRIAREHNIVCAILKEGSPSCGSGLIYDGTFSGRKIPGRGLTAEALINAGIPVFNENEIDEALSLVINSAL